FLTEMKERGRELLADVRIAWTLIELLSRVVELHLQICFVAEGTKALIDAVLIRGYGRLRRLRRRDGEGAEGEDVRRRTKQESEEPRMPHSGRQHAIPRSSFEPAGAECASGRRLELLYGYGPVLLGGLHLGLGVLDITVGVVDVLAVI